MENSQAALSSWSFQVFHSFCSTIRVWPHLACHETTETEPMLTSKACHSQARDMFSLLASQRMKLSSLARHVDSDCYRAAERPAFGS